MEEPVTVSKTSWLQDAMMKGIILGIIHIIIFLIVYYFFPNKLTGFSYLFFIMFFNLGYCLYHGIDLRRQSGGYSHFSSAFKYAFFILLSSGILQIVFTAVFLFIEPSLPDVMADSQLDTSVYWAQKFGAPEETLDQMRANYNPEDVTKRFTFTGQLMGVGFVTIFYAIGAAIVGLIVRKREPEEF